MTAYEIYRVRLALTKRAKDAEEEWRNLKECNDPEKAKETAEAEERYYAARKTLEIYDRFKF
nr:MAG TPA: hypothetical protein [Caudoviricetes sp.]